MKRLLATILLLDLCITMPIAAEERVALVIGNADYKVGSLSTPANDAEEMAATLRGLGFHILLKVNVGQAELKKIISEFGERLNTADTVALFYYSGHGVEIDGTNYMIPVDADIKSAADVDLYGVKLGSVLTQMDYSNSRTRVIILDACRDNPFAAQYKTASRGLGRMDAPPGTLIAYATRPHRTASVGTGELSVYTAALIEELPTPGLPIEILFRRVRNRVHEATGGEQVPWEEGGLFEEFAFVPPVDLPTVGADVVKPGNGADLAFANMASVPAGWFRRGMGDQELSAAYETMERLGLERDPGFFQNAQPATQVWVDAYFIDKYEVSWGDFKEFVKEFGAVDAFPSWVSSFEGGNDYPVVGVTWTEASAYCKWAAKRLPTEAEWEKAARGDDGRLFPWGDAVSNQDHANFCHSCPDVRDSGRPASIDSFQQDRSPYGVYQLAGNVREWVSDWYQSDYYRRSAEKNPENTSPSEYRVTRGGDWASAVHFAMATSRGANQPNRRDNRVGFRCALSPVRTTR